MPLILYHGPAGPQKTQKFLEAYAAAAENRLVVVPDHSSGEKFKSLLLRKSSQEVLLGTSVMSFEDLLFKFIKINRHRAHRADELACCYLLFLLATRLDRNFFKQGNFFSTILELYHLMRDLKSAGEAPEIFFKKFAREFQHKKLDVLAARYQSELAARHHFDSGDLFLETLRLLDGKKTQFLPHFTEIFFIGHYPLHAGHRKILRLLKEKFPQLSLHVFYDEDFARRDDLLSLAYEDLGSMAERQEYVVTTKAEPPRVTSFANPVAEALWVAAQIRQKIDQGARPQDFAIVVTPQNLFDHERALSQVGIAHASSFGNNIAEILPSPLLHQHGNLPEEKIAEWTQGGDKSVYRSLQALALLDLHAENADFLKNLFGPLRGGISEDLEGDFWKRSRELVNTKDGDLSCQLALCSLESALALDQREIFVTGLNLEQISGGEESALVSPELYQKTELLKTPAYQFRIRLEKIFHLIANAANCHLSRFENDPAGKPTTALPQLVSVAASKNLVESMPLSAKTDFVPVEKSTFSLSEIETYLSCPYKYYASHVLKLGQLDSEDLEPRADAKGSFVHEILQIFLSQHQKLYRDDLIRGALSPEIPKILDELILNRCRENSEFKKFTAEIVADFTHRVRQTLLHLFERELALRQEGKKLSLPAHFEWPVAKDGQRGFPLKVEGKNIRITARIDRIDLDGENAFFTVIDYKTGQAPQLAEIKSGRSLQLPFYTLAVQTFLYPGFQDSAAVYYNLGDGKISGFTLKDSPDEGLTRRPLTNTEWEEISTNCLKQIASVVQKMARAEFAPKPVQEKNCDWCDYRRICAYRAQGSDDDTDD